MLALSAAINKIWAIACHSCLSCLNFIETVPCLRFYLEGMIVHLLDLIALIGDCFASLFARIGYGCPSNL